MWIHNRDGEITSVAKDISVDAVVCNQEIVVNNAARALVCAWSPCVAQGWQFQPLRW